MIEITSKSEQHFWSKVDKSGECWLWQGASSLGYGHFYFEKEYEKAHRFSLRVSGRVIPEGLEPDHTCDVKLCVNPDHLVLKPHAENCARSALLMRKETCKRGHPMDEGSAKVDRRGVRYCAPCATIRATQSKRNRKQRSQQCPA
jgi:hypothetical protein